MHSLPATADQSYLNLWLLTFTCKVEFRCISQVLRLSIVASTHGSIVSQNNRNNTFGVPRQDLAHGLILIRCSDYLLDVLQKKSGHSKEVGDVRGSCTSKSSERNTVGAFRLNMGKKFITSYLTHLFRKATRVTPCLIIERGFREVSFA